MSQPLEYWRGPLRCGIENCPSRLFAKHDDGLTYCKEGHQQADIRPFQRDDEEDFATQGRKSRAQKEVQEKVSRVFRGREALELYLQAYQLVLRKQCWALVHTLRVLPAEFETIVKDLWALRLQLLKDRLEKPVDDGAVFSSQHQSEAEEKDGRQTRQKRLQIRGKETPSVLETLCLCYMAVMILRVPVSLGDMHRWAVREDIPFIRVIREVPKAMLERLPAHYHGALDTQSLLEPDDLRTAVQELVLVYNQSFGLILPDLNYPLFLFRYVRELALPLDIYTAVRSITNILSIKFNFPKRVGRQRTISFPELQLMALVIISVKLYYPFDDLKRYAIAETDLGVLHIDWNIWLKEQKRYTERDTADGNLGRGNEMKVNEQQVFQMSEDQLDEYLDWYGKTWIDKGEKRQKKDNLPQELLDMFPTGRLDGSTSPKTDVNATTEADQAAIDSKLKAVQGSLKTREVISEQDEKDGEVRRIGSLYKRYRKEEDLPPQAKAFFEAAAALIAVSFPTMILVVLQTEQLLLNHRAKNIKKAEGDRDIMEGIEKMHVDNDANDIPGKSTTTRFEERPLGLMQK